MNGYGVFRGEADTRTTITIMDRREALQRIGFLMGGVLSASTVAGVLGGCQAGPATEGWVPQTLSPEQNELVTTIAELIIPETDTPGAKAARVNTFIDKMLTGWYKADEREHFLSGLSAVDARAQDVIGKAFMEGTLAEQTEVLQAMEQEALEARRSGAMRPPPFFETMKELTLVGYYTSEIGATQELQWLATPGRYDGCVPLEEIGRTWA